MKVEPPFVKRTLPKAAYRPEERFSCINSTLPLWPDYAVHKATASSLHVWPEKIQHKEKSHTKPPQLVSEIHPIPVK
jgi:hypothetical protein